MVLPPDARKTGSASSCSTPTPTRISPSPTRSDMVSADQVRGIEIATRAISARVLDHRAASPRRGISAAGEGAVGAHRHGADQRQLVRAQMQPSAGKVILMHGHRHIDWIGQCAGMWWFRRRRRSWRRPTRSRRFLHPYLRHGGGRPAQAAAPSAHHRGGRAGPREPEPAGSFQGKKVAAHSVCSLPFVQGWDDRHWSLLPTVRTLEFV